MDITSVLGIALRLVSSLLGMMLLAYVLFAHEDRERKVKVWFESRLADIWVTLDDAENRVSRITLAVSRRILAAINAAMDGTYGHKLFSYRSALFALSYSTATCCIYLPTTSQLNPWGMLLLGILLFVAPTLGRRSLAFGTTIFLLTIFLFGPFLAYVSENAMGDSTVSTHNRLVLALAIPITLCLNVFAIAMIRRALRTAQAAKSLRRLSLLVLLPLFATAIALVVTLGATLFAEAALSNPWSINPREVPAVVPIFLFSIFTMLTSVAFFIAVLLGLLGAIASWTLPTALYPVIKLKIYENRKAMGAAGVALIAIANPSIAKSIKESMSLFGL